MPVPTIPSIPATQPVCDDGYRSSGPSPTPGRPSLSAHVVGLGPVGRAFLHRSRRDVWLRAASDSSASVYSASGLDAPQLADHKASGAPLSELIGAAPLPTDAAIRFAGADIVLDCTATDTSQADAACDRALTVLRCGGRIALAAKHAFLGRHAHTLLRPRWIDRVGWNAVLGGTGLAQKRELEELRARTRSITLVANASSTAILTAVERGSNWSEALEHARQLGLLEADARLDLDGSDLLTKAHVVARCVFGVAATPVADVRSLDRGLDLEQLRADARRGFTHRWIAEVDRSGEVEIGVRRVVRGSTWAVPATQVAYAYDLGGRQRVHLGTGLGPDGTADALLADVHAWQQEVAR